MNGEPDVRPSGWYMLLALPMLLCGISIFLYALIHGVAHATDSLRQVVVPGECQIPLQQAKSYTVFIERQSAVHGKIYSTEGSVNGLECNLVPVGGIQKIEMRPSRMSTTYDVGGRSGRSLFEFRVPEDGTYSFACGYSYVTHGPEVVLAVGSGVGEGIMRAISLGLGGMFGGIASAGVVIVVVFALRQRSRKRFSAMSSPMGI
ncbi:MAG TPA: hypothetical protein VE077_09985 [Candidatus Methylomirabilis sp.]|nr:hypothetical protein [Candidatus Methylomirabilis sp.]